MRIDATARPCRLLLVPATATLLLVAGACGVPDGGPAVEVDAPQTDNLGSPQSEISIPIPSMLDAAESVRQYLSAAAGDVSTRDDRLDQFMLNPGKDWPDPDEGIRVVRVTDGPNIADDHGDEAIVTVTGETIGVYSEFGEMLAPVGDRAFEASYRVVRAESGQWLLDDPPNEVVLSDEAFTEAYEVSPLYFQRKSDEAVHLVPDIRYVYARDTPERVRAELVQWLLRGPSDWLRSVADSAIPSGTTVNQAPVTDGSTVRVDLSSEAVDGDMDAIAAQLAWTLWDTSGFTYLDVQVNAQSQVQAPKYDWEDGNIATHVENSTVYYAAGGGIGPTTPTGIPEDLIPGGITSASLTRSGDRLAVATSSGVSVINAEADGAAAADLGRIPGLPAGTYARPAWAGQNLLLVPIDGDLYAVTLAPGHHPSVQERPIARGVDAVSVAPDGARVALAVNGKATVAPLVSTAAGLISIGEQRRVGTRITSVADVGWSQEHAMIVLGEGPGADTIWEISIDNAAETALPDDDNSNRRPTQLAVQCDDPSDTRGRSISVYVGMDGRIYRVNSASLDPAKLGDVDGPEGSAPFL